MTTKPEILLIYTGGTIGMVKDYESNALKAFDFNHLFEKIPVAFQNITLLIGFVLILIAVRIKSIFLN